MATGTIAPRYNSRIADEAFDRAVSGIRAGHPIWAPDYASRRHNRQHLVHRRCGGAGRADQRGRRLSDRRRR